ncbi:MAG: hypothetical protein ABI874_12585, partial [Chloroflexota bacterium]
MPHTFLARTQEQNAFRQALRLLLPPAHSDATTPFVFLFYGEGGMGKTTLLKRLAEIARDEQPFEGEFNQLFLDWERKRDGYRGLQLGHDAVHPETVFAVLYDEFVAQKWGAHFKTYQDAVGGLKSANAKIEKALQAKPESELYQLLRKWGPKGIATLIRTVAPGGALIPSEPLEQGLDATAHAGAEQIEKAREFVQNVLTPKEFEIYRQPHDHLA